MIALCGWIVAAAVASGVSQRNDETMTRVQVRPTSLRQGYGGPPERSARRRKPDATSVTTANASQATTDEALKAARASIDAGQPREAIARLEGLGRTDDPRVAQLLGVAAYHTDDYARAIALLSPLLDRLAPDSPERRESVQVLGLSLFLSGRNADAIPHLEATRAWASDNLELGHILGQAYLQTGRVDAARGVIARTFDVAPDSAAASLVTAQMMIRLQLEGPAEEELKRAIARDGSLPQAHLLLGQIALFRGRLDECIALTRRELAIAPGNAMAFSQLGDAYVRSSRWDEAIAALQQSLWLNPFYSAPYILLGKAYTRKGQLATAEGMLRRAVEYDPNNRTAHYLLAQLLQQTGRADEARREFAIAEKLQK